MSDSEVNGNVTQSVDLPQTTSSSLEDLSEYTDADECISAPTEVLAEFLSAIMIKDYKKALKYCQLILQYEPNNSTAKDFFPLIVEKLEMNDEDSESESSESSSSTSSSSTEDSKNDSADSDRTSENYSSLEDDEDLNDKNDITNGNAQNIQTNISQLCKEENRPKTDESKSNPKILIHPTPTTTLKRDNSLQLNRTRTYTKTFNTDTEKNINNSPVKNLNRLNSSPKNTVKTPNSGLSKYTKKN